jgi:hypothetical protein
MRRYGDEENMKIALTFALITFSLAAQNPSPALLSNFANPKAGRSQQVVVQATVSCQLGPCTSEIVNGAEGGNRYDTVGNVYYMGSNNKLNIIDPNGAIIHFADFPQSGGCSQSGATATIDTKGTAGLSFNTVSNELNVATSHRLATLTIDPTMNFCNPPPRTNPKWTTIQDIITYALISVRP